jgi:hypothetical protein
MIPPDDLPPAIAERVAAFEQQMRDERAGRRPWGPLVLPGAPPWQPGRTCLSCGAASHRRRCADCTTALKTILARERTELLRWVPTLRRGDRRRKGPA